MMRGKNYGDQNGKNPPANKPTETGTTRRRKRDVGLPADWGNASAELILAAVTAVTQHGAAIRFGYTRDMGAYAIGFYENGQNETEYIPPSEDIDTFLKGVIDDYEK